MQLRLHRWSSVSCRGGGPCRAGLAFAVTWALCCLLVAPGPAAGQQAATATPGGGDLPDSLPPILPDTARWSAAAADPGSTEPLLIPRVDPAWVEGNRLPRRVWDAIPTLPMSQHLPENGGRPSERTEIRMAHDGTAIYFAARMYDREPEGIQAPSLRRNEIPHTNDFFGVLLDSFLDRETAHGFWTNPVGLRTDLLTQNDATGPGAFNYDYNAYWDVSPSRSEEGWFTEVRIPFAALRFQPVDGRVEMGLIVYRRIARKNEWITFPAIPHRWGGTSHFMPSNARPVVFEGVEASRLLLVTPYVLGGVERTHRREALPGAGEEDGSTSIWEVRDRNELEVGLDVKMGLASNLTLDLTVNPDFAQVEADDQEVNLSRFSLFFPEKRRFFQERSSTFDFGFGGSERLFYTRRIGMAGGAPVRIPVGARLAGRVGAWDVGALSVQAQGEGGIDGANHGVVRLKRSVMNANSHVGFMATSLVAGGSEYNVAWGLDASLRVGSSDYLMLQWAQTYDGQEGAASFLDRGLARARLERRSDRGVLFDLDVRRLGGRFLPAMGFIRQNDYVRIGESIGYGWTPGSGARYTSQTLRMRGSALRRIVDGTVESMEWGPSWGLSTRSGYRISLSGTAQREDLAQGFDLPGENRVEAGRYDFWRVGGRLSTPGGDLRGGSVDLEAGTFYDGRMLSVGTTPRIALRRHLELRGRYQYDRLRFPTRDTGLDAHVGRVRLEHQVSTRTSWMAFVQYNSATDQAVGNIRFVYSPREGNDLYVVYNTSGVHGRRATDPEAPFLDTQTLLLKLSITTGPGT
jgi:hypothetical protein